MDIFIVSMIILAASLYIGNMFYQKIRSATSGSESCNGCKCGNDGTCHTCPAETINKKSTALNTARIYQKPFPVDNKTN